MYKHVYRCLFLDGCVGQLGRTHVSVSCTFWSCLCQCVMCMVDAEQKKKSVVSHTMIVKTLSFFSTVGFVCMRARRRVKLHEMSVMAGCMHILLKICKIGTGHEYVL